MKIQIVILTDPKKKSMPHSGRECTWCVLNGKHWVSQEAEGERETLGRGLYCGFQGKEWERQNKQA